MQRRDERRHRQLLGRQERGIGVAQAECTIKKLTKKGNVDTFTDQCRDIQSGEAIEGGTTVLTVRSSTAFEMFRTSYRYCGTKVEF